MRTTSDKNENKCDTLMEIARDFTNASLTMKLNVAHSAALLHHRFQHYTSFDNLIKMVKHKELWLTRSDSLTLDDWNESKKFGGGECHRRTYIGCFSHHSGESAAMWGLYCSPNSRQVKFSIPADAVGDWVTYLRNATDDVYAAESILGERIEPAGKMPVESIDLADILYASVKGDRIGEKSRDGLVRWDGVVSENKIESADVAIPECTARMKDVEWDFEEETRLVVRIKSQKACSTVRRIRVPLTDKMITSMAFTLSPWMPEAEVRDYRAMIRAVIRESVDSTVLGNHRIGIYRSTLCGALGKWASARAVK